MSVEYKNSPIKDSAEIRKVLLQQHIKTMGTMDYMYDSDSCTPIYESYVKNSSAMFDDDNDNNKDKENTEIYQKEENIRQNNNELLANSVATVALDLKDEFNRHVQGDKSPSVLSTESNGRCFIQEQDGSDNHSRHSQMSINEVEEVQVDPALTEEKKNILDFEIEFKKHKQFLKVIEAEHPNSINHNLLLSPSEIDTEKLASEISTKVTILSVFLFVMRLIY